MRLQIKVEGLSDFEFNLNDLSLKLNNFSDITDKIAEDAKDAVLDNFQDEASGYPRKNKWAPLAVSTQKRRARVLGQNKAAHPILVFTGEMKRSIKAVGLVKSAVVFTKDPKAIYHVFGTKKIPIRNFLQLDSHSIEKISEELLEWLAKTFK